MVTRRRRAKTRYEILQWTPDSEALKAYNSVSLYRQGHRPFTQNTVDRWRREAGHTRSASEIVPAWPNGRNDPASIALVLDCLLRLSPGPNITSAMLVGFLQDQYAQIDWDAVTVGRILGQLVDAAHDKTPHGTYEGGNPDAPITHEQNAPIYKWRNAGLTQFCIEDNLPARHWLGAARSLAARMARYRLKNVTTADPTGELVWGPFSDLPYGTNPTTYWNELLAAGAEVAYLGE